jgi:cytochrome P450
MSCIFLYFCQNVNSISVSTWRTHRKIINQTFSQTILNSYLDIFVRCSNELVANLKKNYDNCETDIFTRYLHLKLFVVS